MSDISKARVLALFSGGLDSILAARLVQEQGMDVQCLHFVTPFFGTPEKVSFWRKHYGLNVRCIDIGDEFVRMLAQWPAHGFGSVLNPCVDCKILMMRQAKRLMEEEGAVCVVSGEVLGQRPMSQRRDTLNIIHRDAELKGKLLRPLSALLLDPTEVEEAGIIDRTQLLGIAGRGRKQQVELAARWGITDFPQPSGGCRLTEQENARSYWPILAYCPNPLAADFYLANTGRQFWYNDRDDAKENFAPDATPDATPATAPDATPGAAPDATPDAMPDAAPATAPDATPDAVPGAAFRLIVGRKKDDNERLMELAGEQDLLFKVRDFPGPIAVGRHMGSPWPQDLVASAAAFVASYCPKAVRHAQESGEAIAVRVHTGSLDCPGSILTLVPGRSFAWREWLWEEAKSMQTQRARQK